MVAVGNPPSSMLTLNVLHARPKVMRAVQTHSAAQDGFLQEFEQRQALRQREGLQRCAQRGVLLIERGDRLGEVQALQIRDRLLQLRLLTGRNRLLRCDGIQPPADGGAHIGSLVQRLIDVVDRAVDGIVQRRRRGGRGHAGLQRADQILHGREHALIGAWRQTE